MTDEDTFRGGTWGGYGAGPGLRRTERVLLLAGLEPGDDGDLSTWTHQGATLTAQQQAIVRSSTPDEWADCEALLRLDLELDRQALERLRRRRDGLPPDTMRPW